MKFNISQIIHWNIGIFLQLINLNLFFDISTYQAHIMDIRIVSSYCFRYSKLGTQLFYHVSIRDSIMQL